jgi:hypothetical protein
LADSILRAVWAGYDLLVSEVLENIDWTVSEEEVERQLTQVLEPRIRRSLSGFEIYDCQHGTYENETRKPAPAQPPQYDIAFVFRNNPRLIWPLEAKYLRISSGVGAYVKGLRENFLSGRYAPFSGEAAMVAYLGEGTAEEVWAAVARKVPCEILASASASMRPQRYSRHNRALPESRPWNSEFLCHHLVMRMRL